LNQLVKIEVFGQPYTFRAEDGGAHAQEVADYLVKEITRYQEHDAGKDTNANSLAILLSVALNLANENFELKSKQSELMNDLSQRAGQLIDKLKRPG
jgi:cell division protein ZapA (FtsZ GTPase activity inhibitor)